MRRMLEHSGDVSEGTKCKVLAERVILNKKVTFYTNGLRKIEGVNLNDEDKYNSEILRFAQASILIGEPVGDKRKCYVDATKNPVEVWVHNLPLEEFLTKSKHLVETQQMDIGFLLEEPLSKVLEAENVGNVRLFGR